MRQPVQQFPNTDFIVMAVSNFFIDFSDCKTVGVRHKSPRCSLLLIFNDCGYSQRNPNERDQIADQPAGENNVFEIVVHTQPPNIFVSESQMRATAITAQTAATIIEASLIGLYLYKFTTGYKGETPRQLRCDPTIWQMPAGAFFVYNKWR